MPCASLGAMTLGSKVSQAGAGRRFCDEGMRVACSEPTSANFVLGAGTGHPSTAQVVALLQ